MWYSRNTYLLQVVTTCRHLTLQKSVLWVKHEEVDGVTDGEYTITKLNMDGCVLSDSMDIGAHGIRRDMSTVMISTIFCQQRRKVPEKN